MKNLKSKLLILLISIISLTSLLFVGSQKNEDVYAKLSDVNVDTFNSFSVSDFQNGEHTITKNLFGTGNETAGYYAINVTSSGTDKVCSKTVSDNGIGIYVKGTSLSYVDAKVYTQVVISQALVNAAQNNSLSVKLQADLNPKYKDEHYIIFKNGSNSVQSESVSSNTVETKSVTLSNNQISSTTFDVEFHMYRPSGKIVVDTQLQVYNPQLIITTTDVTAPTITYVGNETHMGDSREINFKVSDNNGSGIKYLKYNGVTYDNVSESNTYTLDARYDTNYTIEVCDNVGNVYTDTILADTTAPKKPVISGFGSVIHTNKTSFLVEFEKDTTPHTSQEFVYYTIVSLKDYNDGNYTLDKTCSTLDIGTNTIDLGSIPMGTYKLLAKAIDNSGKSSDIVDVSFEYDTTLYTLNLSAIGGKITSVKIKNEECFQDGKTAYTLWYKDSVSIGYEADDGYEFFDCIADDKNLNLTSDYSTRYDLEYSKQATIEVKFRYRVNANFESSYEFTKESGALKSSLLNDFTLSGSTDRVLDKNIIEIEIFDSENVLTDEFYNAGTYKIVWRVLDEFSGAFVGSGETYVTITPKLVKDIIYSNYSDLVYSAENQNISVSLENSNLSDDEKTTLSAGLHISYFDISDTGMTNPYSALSDAGQYFAKVTFNDSNYIAEENTILDSIVVAKKVVSASVVKSQFDYNESVRSIEYSILEIGENAGDISSVSYEKKQDDESYISSEFKNAGDYKFTISLNADYAKNYTLENNNGECQINTIDVYFELEKLIYDYTGSIILVEFKAYNSESVDKTEIVSLNNAFAYTSYKFNAETSAWEENNIQEVGQYSITFRTSDSNYNLIKYQFENIEVKQTIISIVVETEYEYTGTSQVLKYTFQNEAGESLQNVVGIECKIYKGEEEISSFVEVGNYSYKFIADPKFVINGTTQGEFSVLPAYVEIVINNGVDTLEYLPNEENKENLENYNLDYSIISTKNTDFKSLGFIDLIITKSDELAWGDVGTYTYTFVSNNGNVLIILNDEENASTLSGTLQIVPRVITASIQNEYEYCNADISLSYNISEYFGLIESEIEVKVNDELNGKMFNVGTYLYTLSSINQNYEIVLGNAILNVENKPVVEVKSKVINIASITKKYTYSGEEIEIELQLENPFDEEISYRIVKRQNSEIVERIQNAGTYSIEVISENNNYKVLQDYLEIVVSPKFVNIQVGETIGFIYNGQIQKIDYSVLVDDAPLDVLSEAVYWLSSDEEKQSVSPIYASTYGYEIRIANPNYYSNECVGEFTIAKKPVNVIATSGQYKIYGDEDLPISYTIDGKLASDDCEVSLARESGEDVGLYYISYVEDSCTNDNYEIRFADNTYAYEIVAKKLVIIADKQTKIFGEEDGTLSYKILMNGALASDLLNDDVLSGELTRVAGENVGSYDIQIGSLFHKNYSITFVKNTLTIEPKSLDIIIDNIETTYGQYAMLTYHTNEEYNAEFVYGEPTRVSGEDVGEYEISAGTLTSKNYRLNITNAIYKINPKKAYVKALNVSKTYGDDDVLDYEVSGLLDGDILSGELTRVSGEDVGTYEIQIGTINNPNYDIEFTSGVLTIEKAKLSISFDNKSQIYGEKATPLTYKIEGLKNDETLDIKIFRESGNDVGEYEIAGAFKTPSNYVIDSFVPGKYTIEKAKIVPVLNPKTCVYNGKPQSIESENFEYELEYVYKLNGFVVDECIDAGTYQVYAEFKGNNNYYPAKSAVTTLVIEKQFVFITITNTEFIYDGEIKYPEFSYDLKTGIDENAFTFRFENDVFPKEEGEYNFAIIIDNPNFEGQTQGTLKIQKPFAVVNNSTILECAEATFDSQIQNVKLVQTSDTKKFNNENVVTVCTLENIDKTSQNNYVYTVKIKATSGVDSVKVYKVGLTGFSEQAIKVENGYYVFKIDDPNDKYIITTEPKTLSTLAWILILVSVAVVFGIALIVVIKYKHKKAKVAKVSDKDIETYNVN